jgi:hypothetical protein
MGGNRAAIKSHPGQRDAYRLAAEGKTHLSMHSRACIDFPMVTSAETVMMLLANLTFKGKSCRVPQKDLGA